MLEGNKLEEKLILMLRWEQACYMYRSFRVCCGALHVRVYQLWRSYVVEVCSQMRSFL
jgi:hypothetical protein